MKRKLAAIIVADIVGYSRLVSEDDIGTFESVTAGFKTIDEMVDRGGGHVFNVAGDCFVAVFSSAVDAVSCAMEILDWIQQFAKGVAKDRQIHFRIGVSLGDVIEQEKTLLGEGVNIAARLEALSDPDTVFVSGDIHRQVKNKLDLEFTLIGERQLKNIPDPVIIYRVGRKQPRRERSDVIDSREPQPMAIESTSDSPPSMVIMPFENLSRDPEQEYFCDGLTDVMTTEMSKFRHVFVIAAHSAFTYKNKTISAQQVGRELRVQYLLEGSVQRSSDRVRVSAQLVETKASRHLWAERFDVEGADIFLIQDEIIQRIVTVLALKVGTTERRRVLGKETPNLNAYESYLKGVHTFSQKSQRQLDIAREMFERACKLDPKFARAWGYLAYTHVRGYVLGWTDEKALETALVYANTAVDLDSEDYSNIWDLAFVHLNLGRVDQAVLEYERAFALNPNDADMLAEMAVALIYAGESQRAIKLIQKSMKINPYFPDWYRWNMGWANFNAKSYDRALEEFTKIADPAKNVWLKLAASYARLQRQVEAAEALNRFIEMEPGCTVTDVKSRFPFKRQPDENHWLESLRLAGMPE
jgi:TolB-like protein